MKTHIARILLVSGLLAFNGLSQAQVVAAHYPAGAEGIKGASLRYVYEFDVASRPEGQLVAATLTRRF